MKQRIIDSPILKIKYLYTALFVIMPILDQYLVLDFTFFEMFTIISVGIFILTKDKYKTISSRWIMYFLYTVAVTFCVSVFISSIDVPVLFLRIVKFAMLVINLFCVAPKLFDFEYGFKLYTFIVVLASIILLIQYIIFVFWDYGTMLLIPGISLNYNGGINSTEFMNYTLGRIETGYYYRPCAIFIEPAYQVQYSITWLAIEISFVRAKKNKKNIWKLLVVSLALVLTTSFLGIVCVAVLWGIEFLRLCKSKKMEDKRSLCVILPVLVIAVVFLLSQPSVLITITSKINSMLNVKASSSFSLRLLRGWECFKGTTFGIKLFGCGYGNLTAYYNQIGLRTIYDGRITDISYMNGIFTLICSVGVIGASTYIYILTPIFRRGNYTTKMLFVCWGLLMISSACFDSGMYLLLMAFLCTSVQLKN